MLDGLVGPNGLPVRGHVTVVLHNSYVDVIHRMDVVANQLDIKYVTCR